jgi:hypothetical protein
VCARVKYLAQFFLGDEFWYTLFLVPKADMRNCCLEVYLSVHFSNGSSAAQSKEQTKVRYHAYFQS